MISPHTHQRHSGECREYDRPRKDFRRGRPASEDEPMQRCRREKGCPTIVAHVRFGVSTDWAQVDPIRNPVEPKLAGCESGDCARTCAGVGYGSLDVTAKFASS